MNQRIINRKSIVEKDIASKSEISSFYQDLNDETETGNDSESKKSLKVKILKKRIKK